MLLGSVRLARWSKIRFASKCSSCSAAGLYICFRACRNRANAFSVISETWCSIPSASGIAAALRILTQQLSCPVPIKLTDDRIFTLQRCWTAHHIMAAACAQQLLQPRYTRYTRENVDLFFGEVRQFVCADTIHSHYRCIGDSHLVQIEIEGLFNARLLLLARSADEAAQHPLIFSTRPPKSESIRLRTYIWRRLDCLQDRIQA